MSLDGKNKNVHGTETQNLSRIGATTSQDLSEIASQRTARDCVTKDPTCTTDVRRSDTIVRAVRDANEIPRSERVC